MRAAYLLMERHLLTLTDAALNEELDELADEVKRVPSQSDLPAVLKARFPGHEGYELQVRTDAGEPVFRSAGIGSTGLPTRPSAPPGRRCSGLREPHPQRRQARAAWRAARNRDRQASSWSRPR